MSCIAAIVPVKPLQRSKSRLSQVLTADAREALAAQLLQGVLRAVGDAHRIDTCWVIGGDTQIKRIVAQHRAHWKPELGENLNHTLDVALNRLTAEVTAALILPMDLPFLTGEAIDEVVSKLTESTTDVVIVPDRWGSGTNALLQVRPFALQPAFGRKSLSRHLNMAASQGLGVRVCRECAFAFDLDTPADLAASGLMADYRASVL